MIAGKGYAGIVSREKWIQFLPDVRQGLENLLVRKLRSLLTMLGMIFGVGAVVSMLSIGAGAQQQVMAFIEQLGVHNLLIEAKEATNWQEYQKARKVSPGLTFQDLRVIQANLAELADSSPRKRVVPSKTIPKAQGETPVVYGISPAYQRIANLSVAAGRFFDNAENENAAPVCVLGERARSVLFGQESVGGFVKVNDQWLRVIGRAAPQLSVQAGVADLPTQDSNNLIYVPIRTAILRLAESNSRMKDEIDGIELRLKQEADVVAVGKVVRGILNSSHRNANDFSLIVPAELLSEQKRTERIFDMVMVAIASISLLVGGIGIMNIMLATVLERTHEIGIRRAVGARQRDIVRQFLIEGLLIASIGGLIGIFFGSGLSRIIAALAGWSTIVTTRSILLAFLVSLATGLVFGVYPAAKAARLDPIEALRRV